MLNYNNAEGLFGFTNGTWNNLGQATGLLGTGYGLYDSLLGNKSKLFKRTNGNVKGSKRTK